MSTEQKKGGWRTNKWIRAAIPALLLHCSIGTVYCWSLFSENIRKHIGFSKGATEWAFSFAIFFLGMSAAFLGNVVEKDIHKSSLIAAICFAVNSMFSIVLNNTHQYILAKVGIIVGIANLLLQIYWPNTIKATSRPLFLWYHMR